MLLNKLGLIFIIFTTLFNNVFNQQIKHGCENASDEETKIVCKNMVEAMKNASEYQDNNPLFKPGFQPDSAPDRPELKCLTLNCYCSYLGGISNGSINDCTLPNGQKLKKAIRKELRMLTDEERNEIFAAIREMKNSNDYDYIAAIHRLAYESGGAHGGAAFCVWHLEYIKRFEILLRKRNPSAALPYWDSTLEDRLPTPKDSILFTDDFFGTTDSNGYVTTGPFSPWQTLEGNTYITRNVGKGGGCMSEENIQWTLSQTKIENVMAYTLDKKECPYDTQWKALEFPHGKIHNFIGGDMEILFPNRAANDFAFFAHHCFVNLIYETWRQTKQTPTQRLNDYPADIAACESTAHFKNATMSQFAPLKNADGLRNEYTDNLYEYAPRPTCTNSDVECGSKYLFCDLSHDSPHCAAKVKPGGNCKGFNKGEQVCMNSTCVNDICIVQSKTTIKSEKTFTSTSKITLAIKNITKQNDVKTTKEKTPISITTLPNIVTTTITPKTSVKFLASTHKISINTTTFIKTITSITTRKTQETTNELITTKMAEETTDFPEKSTTEIPEETTQNLPEETTQNLPEETTQNIPEETTQNIPEETTQNFPETTSALPTKPTENLTTKSKTFTTTQKQTTTTTNHSKTKKTKKHHKKHSKHHKTFMTTFSTIKPFFTTKQPTTKMFTTVKPVKKGKKCKCNKKHSQKKLPKEKNNHRSSTITIPDQNIVLRFPNFVNPTGKPPKN